jgi:hypothetical protein
MLYHVKYRGNKNKWLLYMIGMLWISQVGVFLFGFAFDKLFVRLLKTPFYIWLSGMGLGVYYLFFNVSHLVLAEKYRIIAEKVPAALKGEPEPQRTRL